LVNYHRPLMQTAGSLLGGSRLPGDVCCRNGGGRAYGSNLEKIAAI
jgi:hypothetical protein